LARVGLSTDAIVEATLQLIDEAGPSAVNLMAVADRVGVRQPSMYKHVDDANHLRRLVALAVMTELQRRIEEAVMGRAGEDALRELMRAYRQYVVERPGRYAMFPAAPLLDPLLEPSGRRLMAVIATVLERCGITRQGGLHAMRAIRAAAHGFASLEAAGGFGSSDDLDASYDLLVNSLIAGLRASPEPS